jgi:hypothetical protein
MQQKRSVEDRLTVTEATLEIMRLKSIYAECADGKYTDEHQKKPTEARDAVARQQVLCFTEDGEFHAGVFGSVKGHDALFENFRSKPFIFAMHVFTNPVIDVDPTTLTAKGRWLHHLFVTEDDTGRAMHGMGYTFDEYRCVDGKWLFSRVETRLKFLVPFGAAWSPAQPTQQ